jgi:hypothetical protein
MAEACGYRDPSRTKRKKSKHRNCPERPSDSGQLYYFTRDFINQNLGIQHCIRSGKELYITYLLLTYNLPILR